MLLNKLALILLLGLSQLLGVSDTPQTNVGSWRILQPWIYDKGGESFFAESTAVAAECQIHPDAFIQFPQVIHGAHEVFADHQKMLSFGDPNFASFRSFYGSPDVKCHDLAGAQVVRWKVYSYSRYFARMSSFPMIVTQRSHANLFSETMNILAAGSLIAITVLVMILFFGKIETPLVVSVAMSGLLLAMYFTLGAAEFFDIHLSMITAHRFADLGVIGGFALFFNGLRLGGVIRSLYYWIYLASLSISMLIIAVADSGDAIQLGTSLAFAPTIAVTMAGVWSQLSSIFHEGKSRQKIFASLSLCLFLFGFLNEIVVVTGVIQSYTVANICCMFGFMFYAFTVNERIVDTYIERDYLRDYLEHEVDRKTAQLEKAMNTLQLTQADLVQSAKLASLGTLAAGIAHEINNSLNYVSGAIKPIEKILRNIDLGESKVKIEALFNAASEGLSLTFSIIKSLKNYTGLNQAKFNDVSVYETLKSVEKLIHSNLRQVELKIEVPQELRIFGNVVGLNQIFMNLIGNAVDAMEGKGSITIRSVETSDLTVILITDTGKGIEDGVMERIFEPFFTTKDVGKGTGLGLHIVMTEVKRHHGNISVESAPDKGTTFRLEFPRYEVSTEWSAA